jgi:hypothetical protein
MTTRRMNKMMKNISNTALFTGSSSSSCHQLPQEEVRSHQPAPPQEEAEVNYTPHCCTGCVASLPQGTRRLGRRDLSRRLNQMLEPRVVVAQKCHHSPALMSECKKRKSHAPHFSTSTIIPVVHSILCRPFEFFLFSSTLDLRTVISAFYRESLTHLDCSSSLELEDRMSEVN